MPTDFQDLNTDEELGSDHGQSLLTNIENRLKELHTCLPGIIQSYDNVKNTVSVQPLIQRVFVEDGAKNLPLIQDVPVVWPGGGDWAVTFPIVPGDECVLVFSERCIDYWHVAGEINPPAVYRLHDLSDAFAFIGVRNQTRILPSIQTDGVELRNTNRSVFFKLTATGVQIHGDVSVTGSVSVTGDVKAPSATNPTQLVTLATHEHAPGSPQTSRPLPPI